ncbi:hypothetical protein GIB67_030878 [Kingdonia uniflora]|uniref:Uncharacterized protein n=1 Tax=Kingdonia uniflora TaxID=39325 RepID=A0A7J7L3I1_9MAGN|nr:hypothetical protein GIB67_030878 [Kingdonia uniflora]
MENASTSNNNRGRTEWTPPMDRYFLDLMLKQEHPEVKPIRTKTMPNYHDLDKIYGKSTATGQYARSAKDLKSKKLCDVNITQVQDSSDDTAVEDDSPLVNNKV